MKDASIIISEQSVKEIVNNISSSKEEIKKSFDRINKLVSNVSEFEWWVGTSSDAFVQKHQELAQNYPKIDAKLQSYIDFLNKVVADHQAQENTLKTNIANSDGILDM